MNDAPYFETTFTPDYGEMFAVSVASRRYQFTAGQRHVWWVPMLLYFSAIYAILFWGDLIGDALYPVTGAFIAAWSPLGLVIGLGILCIWLVCYKLNLALSARWIAQRKPPQPTRFSTDHDALRWESEDSGMWVKWSAIERLFVTPCAVCFLHGGVTLYIPRRVFSDPAAQTAFLDRALPRLSESARAISEADPKVRVARKA